MKTRKITSYKKTGSFDEASVQSDRMLTSYPTETLIEKDKKYIEQNILIPEFSVPEFVAKLYSCGVFGSYYLYFSSKT